MRDKLSQRGAETGLRQIQAECQGGPARMWPPGPSPFDAITLGLFSQRLPLIAAILSC